MQDPCVPERFAREGYADGARAPRSWLRCQTRVTGRGSTARRGGSTRCAGSSLTGRGERCRRSPFPAALAAPAERPDRQSPTSWRAGERAADALRRVPAWSITAACGLAYVIAAPPSSDLAAAGVSQRTVRARWFCAVGQRLVRRPPPPRLLAAGAGARRGDERASLLAALSMVAATALFTRLIDGLFAAQATRVAGDLVRRGRLGVAAGQPRAVRPRPRARAGLPARRAPSPARARARPGADDLARQSRRGRVPRARAARLGAHHAFTRADRVGAGAGRRGAGADRAAAAGLPRRRRAAVRGLVLLAGARGRAGDRDVDRARGTRGPRRRRRPHASRAAHRRAAVRGDARGCVRDPQRGRRQRRPPRRTSSRARSRPWCCSPSAPACSPCWLPSCSTGRSTPRCRISARRCPILRSTAATTRRCWPSCATWGWATGSVRHASRWSQRAITPRRASSLFARRARARLGAPAGRRAQRAVL